jgi:hypothetical protein
MNDEPFPPAGESVMVSEAAKSGETGSRRYWRAAISHLSDPQKRDAAWEFYLRRLEARKSGDTLSALVLLLEANGAFLSSLPEKIQEELMGPLADRLATMRRQLAEQEEHQRQIVTILEKASERNANTNARSIAVLGTAEGALRKAATSLDASALVREVKEQIEKEALVPFKRVLKDLAISGGNIREATMAAEVAIEKWRRVHLRGIAAGLFAAATVASFLFVAWSRHEIEKRYEERLAAAVMQLNTNHDTLSKLTKIGIGVHIFRSQDSAGIIIPGRFTVAVDGAETTEIQESDGRRQGVIFVKSSEILPIVGKTETPFGRFLVR